MQPGRVPSAQKGPGASSDLRTGQGAPHKYSGGCEPSQEEDERLTSLWWADGGGGGWRRHVFQCVSFYCRREESARTRGPWGITPTFQAPVLVSLAVEGRNSNRVINFFFRASLFSLNLGCMLAVDSASQNPYLLQGHTQQCFPWASVMAWSCSGLRDTDPVSRLSPALSVCNRDAFQ